MNRWIIYLSMLMGPALWLPAEEFVNAAESKKAFGVQLGELFEDGKTLSMESMKEGLAAEPWADRAMPRPGGRRLAPEKIYRDARHGVVQMGTIYRCASPKCGRVHLRFAGGFIIDKSGIVVTNYHVVDPKERDLGWGIRTFDGRVFPVTGVLAADQHNDIAVLQVDAENLTALPLAEQAEVGEPIYALHHPVGQPWIFTEGMVSGKVIREIKGEPLREVTITADFAKGSSGSPILNGRGQVMGMVRTTRSVYYRLEDGKPTNLQMVWKNCVPVSVLRERLGASPAS